MMQFHSKKIGVWGLGIVGKSAVRFFYDHGIFVDVMENRQLTQEEKNFLHSHQATFFEQNNINDFLQTHDLCLASPGIDVRPYHYYDRFISELDIFGSSWHKSLIAVTGSVGKTTVTHLLSQILLRSEHAVVTGGNIGIGMLDLLQQQEVHDYALLEVSSFQLEKCKAFAPTLALWTNFHPNHLDRHGTNDEYFKAKARILLNQKDTAHAILPLEIISTIRALIPHRPFIFFSSIEPSLEYLNNLYPTDSVYYSTNNEIMYLKNGAKERICSTNNLPPLSFMENWILIIATLKTLGMPLSFLFDTQTSFTLPEHRLELVAIINGVAFYNDSKSTIPAATIAALNTFINKPVILFVGGISKGVDRLPFIKFLAGKVKTLYCFGKESHTLHKYASNYNIESYAHDTIESALAHCIKNVKNGDNVLFSPAGASFDLFKNYEERGKYFKQLISQYKTS